jgi:hypothetical protein
MVTVIGSKEELTTPVNNGVNNVGSSDNERSFIKDYQEVRKTRLEKTTRFYFVYLFKVDFHRTASCKPLPEDLFETVHGQISKSSVRIITQNF